MKNKKIDGGKSFDWGKTSEAYGKYRDIYPQEFYEKLYELGIGLSRQKILDIATGTGVLPRNMQKYSPSFVGIDIAENQIKQAKFLSENAGLDIEYLTCAAEDLPFEKESFDAVTACQCFWYFDIDKLLNNVHNVLKKDGLFAILIMSWLPYEDEICKKSEELVLKYSPNWTGAGYKRHEVKVPTWLNGLFSVKDLIGFDVGIPFTRKTWNGRMKACRGVGASLTDEEIKIFEKEHAKLLSEIAPEKFEILHYVTMIILKKID